MKFKILLFALLLNLQSINSQCLFKEVTTLNATSFAIGTDNKLYGWGFALDFNLNTSTVKQSNVTQIGVDENWIKIDGGNRHILLLKSNGTLWSMGFNGDGQLGDNSLINKNVPIQVGSDNNWVAISAGQNFSLALKNDGTLWAWGNNQNGQLGIGNTINQMIPVQVGNETNWSKINAAKSNFSLAIKSDGTLWAWGRNDYGYLGLGDYSMPNIPTQVGTSNNWLNVSSGINHTIALKSDNTLWAWGKNGYGELGNNTTINSNLPIQIGLDNDWQFIDANYLGSKAIKLNGTLWCWGENSNGQIGDGTLSNRLIPTRIDQDTNWSGIFSGQSHTLAIKTDSKVYSWGTNNYSQLGDGGTNNLLSPYLINCLNLKAEDFDFQNNSIKISPNPTDDEASIEISENVEILKIELMDLNCRIIYSANNGEHKLNKVNLNNFNGGIYLAKIQTNKGVCLKKIVKNNYKL